MKNIVLEKIYDYLFQLSRAQALDALEQAITKTTDEEPQIRYSTGKGNILVRLSLKTSYLCLPAHCPSYRPNKKLDRKTLLRSLLKLLSPDLPSNQLRNWNSRYHLPEITMASNSQYDQGSGQPRPLQMGAKGAYIVRLLMVGDSSCGKTSLVLRFDQNVFSTKFVTTIGVDYRDKMVKVCPNVFHA